MKYKDLTLYQWATIALVKGDIIKIRYDDKMVLMEKNPNLAITKKALSFVRVNVYPLSRVNPSYCINMITHMPWFFSDMKECMKTPEFCVYAVKRDSSNLKHVKVQSHALCMYAVKEDGHNLEHVINQTPEICLAAIIQNPSALKHVKDQTYKMCYTALKRSGFAIRFVKKPTPDFCMVAVKRTGCALRYIKVQTPEIQAAAIASCKRANKYFKDL